MLGLQTGNREPAVLTLNWSRTTPANGTPTETDAPVSFLHPVQNRSQPMLSHPPASQQTTAEAAHLPAEVAQSTAKTETSSKAVSHTAVSEAVLLQQPNTPTAVAPAAVSTQDMPQLALQQPQHVTASVDEPQPATSRVQQPASKLAAAKKEEEPPATAEGIQRQAAAPNMDSPSAALALEVDEPQLATAEGSQPPAAAAAPEIHPPSADTISEADQSQLAIPVEGQPQPGVTQFLDLLFPPEQPQALSTSSPTCPPAVSSAVSQSPVLHAHTGKADANDEDCCMSEN